MLCDFWHFKSIGVFKALNIREICGLRCGQQNFYQLIYFLLGFIASPPMDFWILGRHGCFGAQFLTYLMPFHSSSKELHASALDS